jgi:phage tail protein X
MSAPQMIGTTRTMDGDTADQIALRIYGVTAGATEALLDANPNLATLGAVLPVGVVVMLPELAPTLAASPVTRLWD